MCLLCLAVTSSVWASPLPDIRALYIPKSSPTKYGLCQEKEGYYSFCYQCGKEAKSKKIYIECCVGDEIYVDYCTKLVR